MSKDLGGIIGCKDKTSSWHFVAGGHRQSSLQCLLVLHLHSVFPTFLLSSYLEELLEPYCAVNVIMRQVTHACIVITFRLCSKSKDQPGKVANPARG